MTDTLNFVAAIHRADRTILEPLERALPSIARAADAIAARLRRGGRGFYLGAGTSGRLGVLDAAELPPTFGTDPSRWIAVIAGGTRAFTEAIEGAEDDTEQAARDLAAHRFGAQDALVAIAASGTTPYTLAGLKHARQLGALGIAIACVADSPLARAAEIAIELPVGPEVLSGSTRMKAGTSQKLALHTLTTATMNALGLIHRGRMVAMRPTNEKLRQRAVAIVVELTTVPENEAKRLLEESRYELPIALLRAQHSIDAATARSHLAACEGSVDRALTQFPGAHP